MIPVIQQHRGVRQGAPAFGHRDDPADAIGKRHFLAQDAVGSEPRKRIREIAVLVAAAVPRDFAKAAAGDDAVRSGPRRIRCSTIPSSDGRAISRR